MEGIFEWWYLILKLIFYSGSGDVLRIQTLLQFCSVHYQKDKKDEEEKPSKDSKDKSSSDSKKSSDDSKASSDDAKKSPTEKPSTDEKDKDIDYSSTQAISVISISLMAMCDEISSEMALRIFGHMVGILLLLTKFV